MKTALRFVLAAFFIVAGLMHFFRPQPFLDIMPRYLPAHLWLVYISGVFEIAGGVGLLLPRWRAWAGVGLVLLLFAILPANIYMLTDHPYLNGQRLPEWILWLRLPLQGVLMALIWWSSRPPSK